MSKKKILVCGASGFLGSSIFEHLSKRADLEVHGTYLTNEYGRIEAASANRFARADLTEPKVAQEILSCGWDVVIQAAANSSGAKDVVERPYLHVTPNVLMNANLFQAAHNCGVPQCIFLSCTVMYQSKDEPSREEDVDLNKDFSPAYFGGAWMKVYSEKLCEFFSRLGKTKFIAIRHSNIYGGHDRFEPERSHVFGATIRKISDASDGDRVVVWGLGQEVRDFLFVSDFTEFVEKVLQKQNYPFEIYNLGSGEPVTVSELVKKVITISGKNLETVYDPNGPTIGTKISIDSTKARKRFGWAPKTSLDEGIRITLDHYNALKRRRDETGTAI